MLFPSFGELTVLLTLLAILALVPAQLLFSFRETDIIVNKRRFKKIAHILGIAAITFLLIEALIL